MPRPASVRPHALALVLASALAPASALAAPWDKPGYELSFHDEFDASQVDETVWKKRYQWGEAQINGEVQAYVDDAFEMNGGLLRIVGTHAQGTYAGKTFDYRSGVLTSYYEQTYGYFEARCKLPKGNGLWPAFWLYHSLSASNTIAEIDAFEQLGKDPTTLYTTLHWGPSYDQHMSDGKAFMGPDLTADYHVYAVDWDETHVSWYLDGQEIHHYEGPGVPSVPMYVILNLAMGGDWAGPPDATTPFPAYFDVDYVRAYKKLPPGSGGSGGSSGSGGAAGAGGEAGSAGSGGGGASGSSGSSGEGGMTGASGTTGSSGASGASGSSGSAGSAGAGAGGSGGASAGGSGGAAGKGAMGGSSGNSSAGSSGSGASGQAGTASSAGKGGASGAGASSSGGAGKGASSGAGGAAGGAAASPSGSAAAEDSGEDGGCSVGGAGRRAGWAGLWLLGLVAARGLRRGARRGGAPRSLPSGSGRGSPPGIAVRKREAAPVDEAPPALP